MYQFSIGQRVRHIDYDDVIGTVTQCLKASEVDPDMETHFPCPDDPWYKITWDNNECEFGQEPESQLELIQN